MENLIKKNGYIFKIIFAFLLLINIALSSVAVTTFSNRLELLERRFGESFDISVTLLMMCLVIIFVLIFIILFTIIFMKKMPKKLAYAIIIIAITIIFVITILYGKEISEFANMIIKYQMEIVNDTYKLL